MELPQSKKPYVLYILMLGAIWLVIFITAFSFIVSHEISTVEEKFHHIHDKIYHYVANTIKTYEVSIESFASFLATEQSDDYKHTRAFSKQLRSHYPDIYMLEIAKRVTHSQVDELEKNMREAGYHNFKVHTFGYESDKKPHTSPAKDAYYPIVFIEPELSESMGVLGLDLADSSSLLKDALERSFNRQTHVASRPFELIEGNRGYILYREVGGKEAEPNLELTPGQNLYALLVIDTSKLIPEWAYKIKGLSLSLHYPDVDVTQAGSLIKLNNNTVNIKPWYSWIFPDLSESSDLNSPSQPFKLSTQYTIQWSDFDLKRITSYMIIAAIMSPIAIWLTIVLCQRKIKNIHDQRKNHNLAYYDSLTGLPNKHLARELFNQSVSLLKQSKKKMALLYIDLNELKQINDEYSHQVGDIMIQRTSERLKNALHDSDTLARLHGDEFLMLLTNIESLRDIEMVISNIEDVFEPPFILGGVQLDMSLSIGVSVYPDDGVSFDELLDISDQNMYRNKTKERGSVTQLTSWD